jgi:hypothetical protein
VLKNLITSLPFSFPYEPKKNGLLAVKILHSVTLACLELLISFVLTFLLQDTSQNDVFFTASLAYVVSQPLRHFGATKLLCFLLGDAIMFFVHPSCHTVGQHNLAASRPNTTQPELFFFNFSTYCI